MEQKSNEEKKLRCTDEITEVYKRSIRFVTVFLKGKQVELPIFYNMKAYSEYMHSVKSTNNYKEAFCIMLYNMLCNNKGIINRNGDFQDFTLEDIKGLQDEDLQKITKDIIQHFLYYEELDSDLDSDLTDCFEKFYLINKRQEEEFKKNFQRLLDPLKALKPLLNQNYFNKPIIPAVEQLGLAIKWQNSLLSSFSNSAVNSVKIANAMPKIVVPQEMFGQISILPALTNALQVNQAINNILGLGNIQYQKSIQSLGFAMKSLSKSLGIEKPQFNNIFSGLNILKDIFKSSSMEFTKAIILEEQSIYKVFQDQINSFSKSVKVLTHFNYQNKAISFPSIYKETISKIKPFIFDTETILFSRTNIEKILEEKAQTMLEFGWWFVGSLSLELINYIYNNKDELCEEDVNELICSYYTENNYKEIDKIYEKWQLLNCFKKWHSKIKDALDAHKEERYSLSIPVWSFLIEGVVRDFMNENYQISLFRFEPLYKEFKSKVDQFDKFVVNYAINCMDAFYISFNPTEPNKVQDFSRNKIFHGLAMNYDTQANSLKLILYLDELFYIMCGLKRIDII